QGRGTRRGLRISRSRSIPPSLPSQPRAKPFGAAQLITNVCPTRSTRREALHVQAESHGRKCDPQKKRLELGFGHRRLHTRDGRLQQTITPESRHQSRHQPARLGWWWQDSSTPAAHIMMDKVTTSAYRGMSANHRSGDSASSCRTTEPSSYTSGTSSVCSCGFL